MPNTRGGRKEYAIMEEEKRTRGTCSISADTQSSIATGNVSLTITKASFAGDALGVLIAMQSEQRNAVNKISLLWR